MTETVSRAGAEVQPLILAGEFRDGAEVATVVFPYDGSEVARVALADESTVEAALTAAAKAAPRMATVPPFRRAEILHRAAALVASREEELARQMTLETGNAVWETRLEVQRTVEILTIAAEEARRITGEAVPVDALPRGEGRFGITRRFPVGPVVGITPFNAPLLLVAHKLAPAFAAGNPCIIRPATKTPLSALALGQVFVEAGAPEGSVSVIPCRTELAERLACDERVKLLTFTGSCAVGWKLRRIAATPRVTLELGGNGAVIVNRDANLEYAAERCAFGGFLRAGQACISVQRLYVHRDVFDAFTESFLGQIRRLVVGDPLDESTVVGGLVDEAAAEKTMALIDEAKAAGAQVLCGGNRQGTLVEPTVVVDAPEDLRIAAEEAFAPVVALYPYDDFDDALARANDTQFGLQAGLFTNDIRLIHRAFETLEVGGLIVNDVNTFRVDHMPYGGVRKSGFGREGIRYAIREMTEERLLVIDPR
jgi:acyl-CoA reductase-like NAD-dependent aldehyde dehydrogenase